MTLFPFYSTGEILEGKIPAGNEIFPDGYGKVWAAAAVDPTAPDTAEPRRR